MHDLPFQLHKPDAIVVIRAHWEESAATLLGAQTPLIFYDYYGFQEEADTIQYSAPGSPELAQKLAYTLEDCGLSSSIDNQRGFDHGLFIPLKMMYPKADIPSIQLSLIRGEFYHTYRSRKGVAGSDAGGHPDHWFRILLP